MNGRFVLKAIFKKNKVSEQFLTDCRKDCGFIKETPKTIVMDIMGDVRIRAYYRCGCLSRRFLRKEFMPCHPKLEKVL